MIRSDEITASRTSTPNSLPSLALIGVPENMQDKAPGVTSYPSKFSQEGRRVWEALFRDETFQYDFKQCSSAEDKWYFAIVRFLDACGDASITPFANATEQDRNDAAIQYLTAGRMDLVRFADEVGFFEKVSLGKVTTTYRLKDYGFRVASSAQIRKLKDPLFEKWLTTPPLPRFLRTGDMLYSKHIRSNVNMWVRYVNSARITVGYEIDIATSVSVSGKRLPTRKEVDSFIDRVIWKPVLRAHRFKNTNRLF